MSLEMPSVKFNCPYCGQLTERSLELSMRPRWWRIYKNVLEAGPAGIDRKELLVRMYGDDEWPTPGGPTVLRVAIHYINQIIKDFNQRIDGDRNFGYRLVSISGEEHGKAAKEEKR